MALLGYSDLFHSGFCEDWSPFSQSRFDQKEFIMDVVIPVLLAEGLLILGQTRFFSLGEATSLGEGKLWIQTC